MKPESNFKLKALIVGIDGEDKGFSINNLLTLAYIEDIKSASVQMHISLTDTADGALSEMSGMEPVYIEFEDNEGNNFNQNLMVYDIQGRVLQGSKSKGTLVCCSPDLINNASTKVSRRFGTGGGKTIDKIVKEDILEGLLETSRDIDARPTTKITTKVYKLLSNEFETDKSKKVESHEVSEEKRKEKESLRIIQEKKEQDRLEKIAKREELKTNRVALEKPKSLGKIDLNNLSKTNSKEIDEQSPNISNSDIEKTQTVSQNNSDAQINFDENRPIEDKIEKEDKAVSYTHLTLPTKRIV